MFRYYNLPENVSEINPEVKDKDGYITSQQSRSQSKTVQIKHQLKTSRAVSSETVLKQTVPA